MTEAEPSFGGSPHHSTIQEAEAVQLQVQGLPGLYTETLPLKRFLKQRMEYQNIDIHEWFSRIPCVLPVNFCSLRENGFSIL